MTVRAVAEIAIPVLGILAGAWLYAILLYNLFRKDEW